MKKLLFLVFFGIALTANFAQVIAVGEDDLTLSQNIGSITICKIIAKELGILESAIRQNFGINSGNVDIGDIFSKSLAIPEPYSGNQKADAASSILEPILNTADSAADFGQNNHSQSSNSHSSNGNGNGINSTIRQSAIIDIIRQSKKIGLKDVLAAFPDVSERTLRYDLQKLCIQGVLDRIGNGGPATYYTLKM